MATILNKGANGAVVDVDERNFQQEVLERSREVPVVVDFWAPWCGPCRTLGPILERLAGEANGGFVLAKVNVDNNPRLAQAFGVQGIPSVKAVRDGKLVDEFTGALPESQVRAWLQRLVPAPGASQLDEAAALEVLNPQQAAARYQAILQKEPQNPAALLGLGRLLLANGDAKGSELLKQVPAGTPAYSEAQAWLNLTAFMEQASGTPAELTAAVAANPADLHARYQLAAHAVRAGQYETAIEQLLAIVARDRNFEDDAGRRMLLAICDALGNENPLVVAARRKLANLLF